MSTSSDPSGRGSLFRQFSLLLLLLLLLLAGAGGYWWYASPSAVLSGQVVASESNRQPVVGRGDHRRGNDAVRADRFARPLPFEVAAGGDNPGEGRRARLRRQPSSRHRWTAARKRDSISPWRPAIAAPWQRVARPRSRGRCWMARAVNRSRACESRSRAVTPRRFPRHPTGSFQFAAFSENKAEVQAELPGYQKTTTSWVAGARPLTIRLSGGASLEGNVVAEAYDRPTPISGATVRLVGSESAAATDRDGRFCLRISCWRPK